MHLNPRTPATLAGAVLALATVVGAAPPAQAAPPEVNRDDCQAAGGTFDKDKGVKTCTTTATFTDSNIPGFAQTTGGLLKATWLMDLTYQVTTTATQKGNGDVTTTAGTPVLTGRHVHSQSCEFLGIPGTATDCAELYPTEL